MSLTMKNKNLQLTPVEIVNELNKYIVGQFNAKKTVAIALRNKWRRKNMPTKIKSETNPKNIILIGPTGSGKTELAKRIASFIDSPFIKIEATKFTEIGYVGRDVESMIRDLLFISIKMCTEKAIKNTINIAKKIAENRVLKLLLTNEILRFSDNNVNNKEIKEKLREMLEKGLLDNRMISIEIQGDTSNDMYYNNGLDDITNNLQDIMHNTFKYLKKNKKKQLKIKDAIRIISNNESYKLIDKNEINKKAIINTEENGIIFIDEIDKIISRQYKNGTEVSREGVQRDILPIVEGSSVQTRFGVINTHNILFIAAGAFHTSDPSDLIPELQGRFPIKVSLDNLKEEDLVKILFEPKNSLIKQYQSLLFNDHVDINFEMSGIKEIAKISAHMNIEMENIGARRLYTIFEKLMEDISYHAPYLNRDIKIINIDKKYVNEKLKIFMIKNSYNKNIL
jgi:ATP-dependent HslUV protease ATP-binding subunit HslU